MTARRIHLALAAAACALVGSGLGLAGALGPGAPSAASGAAATPRALRGDELTSNDGTYLVRCRIEPEDFEVGDLFAMSIEVRRADGGPLAATLAVDARMPEHGHGMNREPVVATVEGADEASARFEAENLLFHMPGYWEVYLDLTRGALTERAQFSIDLE